MSIFQESEGPYTYILKSEMDFMPMYEWEGSFILKE
jgi:hypothetical protein